VMGPPSLNQTANQEEPGHQPHCQPDGIGNPEGDEEAFKTDGNLLRRGDRGVDKAEDNH